jgi:chitinase
LLTHVNYAFAVINDAHECVPRNPKVAEKGFEQLRQLKAKHPHLKTLISVGGWTDSTGFYATARTAESRATFAKSAAAFANKNGFDGVDIDWEYPGGGGNDKGLGGPEDTSNFTTLLAELRKALDAQGKTDGKRYLLTIASPAGGARKRMELERIAPLLDFINVMTYDFAGSWSKVTAFNAPLYAYGEAEGAKFGGDDAIRAYLAAGVPAEKLCLGVPFYGRAFGGVKTVGDAHGLGQPFDPKAKLTSADGWGWRAISTKYGDRIASQGHCHDNAQVPWLFDPETGLFISYDDPQSLRNKAKYAREQGLGGVMIWELSDDDAEASLLNALHEGLMPGRR